MPLTNNRLPQIRAGLAAAADRGVDRAADHIVNLAQQLCPVDEGDLRSTIRKEGDAGTGERFVKAGGISGPNKFVDYGAFVEYGTDKSPAQPFFFPAVEAIDISIEVEVEVRKAFGI
jgi:HK97 gp10 family phage protein